MVGLVLVPVLGGAGALASGMDTDTTVPLFWALGFVSLGSFLLVRWLLAPTLVEHERRALASLGFDVIGWFEPLAAVPPRPGRLLVTLTFHGAPPDGEKLRAWMGAVDAERRSGKGHVFISPLIRARAGSRGATFTSRRYLAWQARLLERVLKPVHAAHPLASVTLTCLPDSREAPGWAGALF